MQTSPAKPLCIGQAGLGRAGLSFNVRITTLVPNPPSADDQEPIMPVSAYLQAAAFVILAGVALFAAAGTVAILTFWIYFHTGRHFSVIPSYVPSASPDAMRMTS